MRAMVEDGGGGGEAVEESVDTEIIVRSFLKLQKVPSSIYVCKMLWQHVIARKGMVQSNCQKGHNVVNVGVEHPHKFRADT